MLERLDNREVGVLARDVFAHQGDPDFLWVGGRNGGRPRLPELFTLRNHGRWDVDPVQGQLGPELRDELLFPEEERNLVDGRHVPHDNDLLRLHLAVQRELGHRRLCEGLFAAASNDIRNQAVAANRLDGMLRRLCFLLPVYCGNIGHMDGHEVARAGFVAQLCKCLDEWHLLWGQRAFLGS